MSRSAIPDFSNTPPRLARCAALGIREPIVMHYVRTITAALLVALAACSTNAPRPGDAMAEAGTGHSQSSPSSGETAPVGSAPAAARLDAAALGVYPVSEQRYPTTAGSIYVGNLDATIESLEEAGADRPGSPRVGALAGNLYHRFQILGRISDAERAMALLDRIPDEEIEVRTRRLRAQLRTGFHRFDEARADLERASSKGRPLTPDDVSLRGIALARGDYASVRDDFARAGEPSTNFSELVLRGNLAVLQGDLDIASLQFFRAQGVYSDSSPYPLAWLFAQQGIALLRFGHCDKARVFFDAALDRLPGYALALDHLGECLQRNGQLDAARPIYAKLIEQTGNPQFQGAMAVLEKDAGNAALSEQLHRKAMAGYRRILTNESVTWSQHATEFYLAIGEPEQALVQARGNLANRKDVLSLVLFARAAHENGLDDEACAALRKVEATGLKPPEIARLPTELSTACP